MGTIKEIMYFDGMDRKNTDEMVKFAKQRMDDMGIKNVVVVWSSGYTINKFREEINHDAGDLNVIAVTNPSPHSPAKGTMPIVVRPNDSPEVKKRKEEQLAQGITEIYVTITDPIKEELESEGIKVRYLNFFIGSGLAAVAGVFISLLSNLVEPTMGGVPAYKALAIIVLGGLGNVKGTLIASLLLGVIEAFGTIYIGSVLDRDAIAFAFLIVVLMIRPQGLFAGR